MTKTSAKNPDPIDGIAQEHANASALATATRAPQAGGTQTIRPVNTKSKSR